MKRNKTFMSNSKTTELSQFVRLSSMNTILYNPTSALTKNDNNHNGSGVKLVAYNENSFLKATGKYSQNMPKISKTDSFLINSGKKRQQSNIELNAKEIFQPKISELNDIKRLQRNQVCLKILFFKSMYYVKSKSQKYY